MTRESGCPGGSESHDAHMAVDGECPWCSAYEPDSRIDLQAVDEALAAIIPIRPDATVVSLTEYAARRDAELDASMRRHPSNVNRRKDPK